MRWRSSTRSVPAAFAASAKMPYGVSRLTKRVAREMVALATPSTSRSTALRSMPMSATPRSTEKRTTAGTTLLASEWKGLDGM